MYWVRRAGDTWDQWSQNTQKMSRAKDAILKMTVLAMKRVSDTRMVPFSLPIWGSW